MSQKSSPFIESKYGWDFGESGWNTGMDENLLKFSFMFDRNVDSIVASLPAAVNGQAHFLTTDNRLYFAVGNTYFSTPVPNWFEFKDRTTGNTYQFNGTAAVQIDSPAQLDSRLDAVELTLSTLGSAAFENVSAFATAAELDVVEANAQAYTDVLRQDLADDSDPVKGAGIIGRSSQVIGSIAALRLLDKTAVSKQAFVTGYYEQGDGGGGAYYLDVADISSNDNGGTVIIAADGARWKLSQAGVVSVKQFGSKGDGVTDDTAAVQSACDAAGLLFVPAGTYLLSSRITVSDRPFMLYGGGKEVSVLLWSGIAGGFAFSDATGRESATRSPCTLRDLSIVTSQAGGGTALEFDYSADAPGSVYGDATTVTLNNVDIRGDDFYEVGATSYWTVSLHLIDAGGVSVDNARILGMQNGPSTTTGILIEGQQGYSIRYLLSKLHVQWVFWALKIVVPSAYTIEGVYLSQFEFVGVGNGVAVNGGMLHALEITTGHMDCENSNIIYDQSCYGSTALKLASCYLQLGNKRTGAYSSGAHISLPGVNHSTITGNYFLAAPAGSGVTHNGVLLKSTDYSVVDCNDFQNQNGAAIGFITDGVHSDCVGSYAGLGNTFQDVTTELVNSNTNTSAMLKHPKNFSSAWAPGTIAANASATTLISLGGVLPGDPVQISHTGMVASSCLISGYVTAPGQVEVIIFNSSGNPQAIGAGNAVGTVGGVV